MPISTSNFLTETCIYTTILPSSAAPNHKIRALMENGVCPDVNVNVSGVRIFITTWILPQLFCSILLISLTLCHDATLEIVTSLWSPSKFSVFFYVAVIEPTATWVSCYYVAHHLQIPGLIDLGTMKFHHKSINLTILMMHSS